MDRALRRQVEGVDVTEVSVSLSEISEELAAEVRTLLDEGKRLPDEFRDVLFENKREVSLVYADKEREADVLANTMAVPLQAVKSFGSNGDWENMLILGDNLQVLKTLLQMKNDGKLLNQDGTRGVRLCYIDPPFATRREFVGSKTEKAYEDKVVGAQFIEFLRKRLILIRDLLADDGSLYVHLDEKKAHYIKVILDEVFGEGHFQREIVWDTRVLSGFKTQAGNWIRGHDVILYYTRSNSPLFNKLSVPHRQEYLDRFDQVDQMGRRYFGGRGKRRYLDDVIAKGKAIGDVWDDIMSFQQIPTSKEKTGYPTQKPEALLDRIIRASSNPGDLVLDCFLGSGTTVAVAEKLNRRWIGVDSGRLAGYIAQKRLMEMGADKRSLSAIAPFVVYNAGLYDFDLLRSLPWENFRSFALRLFQCKDEPHELGKIELDGYLGLDHVLVYDFMDHPEAVFDETYVGDLHEAIGEKVGRRFFLIAPAASVAFFQDYVELDSTLGPVRYYILRIPYSVIAEIHRRGFSSLQQPVSESTINATVDAVGFDFVQPPDVQSAASKSDSELVVTIDRFSTESMTRSADGPTGLDALAMVLVDFDFEGDVFDLDTVYYAEDLSKTGFELRLPLQALGEKVMLIYLDIYGNEHRELQEVKRVKQVKPASPAKRTRRVKAIKGG